MDSDPREGDMNGEVYNWHDDTGIMEDCSECKWFNRIPYDEPCERCCFGHSAFEPIEEEE